MSNRTCGVDGCDRPLLARELCALHYQRWRKHGDAALALPRRGGSPRPAITERTCLDCGHHGPVADFTPKRNRCRPCHKDRGRRWKERNPEKVAASYARNAAKSAMREVDRKATRKGLDPNHVAAYRDAHSGLCDICGQVPSGRRPWLHVDHDHASGAFRGLLCNRCNIGLGHFKDDMAVLERAIAYLLVSPGDLLHLIQGQPAETTSSDAHVQA